MGAPVKTVAIVNPTAGYRRASRVWPRLLASLGAAGAEITTWWTEWPGHAETLAARARRERFDRVVAVGGDGTLLEVVNGLWWKSRGPQPSVGMVPFGTGCDYVRNFDLGRTLRDQGSHRLRGGHRPGEPGAGPPPGDGWAAQGAGFRQCPWPGFRCPGHQWFPGNSACACRVRPVTSSAASRSSAG